MSTPGLKVLVVDDSRTVLRLLSRQLVSLGAGVVTPCDRGDAALERIADDPRATDLVFCDLNMPNMDGIELVRRLAQLDYQGALVFVSSENPRVLKSAERLATSLGLWVLGAEGKPIALERIGHFLELAASDRPRKAVAARVSYGPDELRTALAEGHLVNHYQPKIELATGRVAGFEALVRWRRGAELVFPDQFIPTAEEHGLIDELTRQVLLHALADLKRWREGGLSPHVAVNVSMENLTDLSFPEFVFAALEKYGIPGDNLILEVTESRVMRDRIVALDILTRLSMRRVGLSIDDFGTGHSSLAQLRELPFEELKVDRSFVHGASRDASRKAIGEASIGMARGLEMRTVAEGVEDTEDWDFVVASGCDLAQGWFIARAMPANSVPGWIAKWSPPVR